MSNGMEPEVLVGKAVTSATADTAFSLLNAQQIEALIDLVVDQNVMIRESRVINVTAPSLEMGNIDIADGQMTGGLGATARMDEGDEMTVTFDGIDLDPEPFEIRYPFETTRLPLWNVEGAGLQRHVDTLVGTYYFNQLEEVMIHGDTGGVNPVGYAAGMMTSTDGWITQAQANGHTYDHGGDDVRALLFENMIADLPVKWRGDLARRAALRFYVPTEVERLYRAWLKGTRLNALGDLVLQEDGMLAYSGIPLIPVPKMHTNDAGVLTQSAVADGLSYVLLCRPENLLLGYNPEMRVFVHPRDDGKVTYVNLWGEYDCGYAIEDEVVVAVNVSPTLAAAVEAEL